MNLKTVTYDTDQWQIVPKELTEQMLFNVQGRIPVTFSDYRQIYSRWLVNAPQPPNLSPWQSIESAPKDGAKMLLAKIAPVKGLPDFNIEPKAPYIWWATSGFWSEQYKNWNDGFEPTGLAKPNYWMPLPLPLPQAPEVE